MSESEEYLRTAAYACVYLAGRAGVSLSDADVELLVTSPDERIEWAGGITAGATSKWIYREAAIAPGAMSIDVDRVSRITEACFSGFWIAAVEGVSLTTDDMIVEWLGAPVRDAYWSANEAFVRFANTFWSMNVIWRSLLASEHVAEALLGRISRIVGDLFFPPEWAGLQAAFPDLARIHPHQRELDQRRMLESFSPMIDIEAFIAGNPVLAEERRALSPKKPGNWFSWG